MKPELITETELRELENRNRHWEEIPKGQFPCSWGSLGRLLATVRARDAEIVELKAQLAARPRSKSKKQRIEEELRASDLTAQTSGRDDIEYGHHETLPRGEHIANRRS